MELRKDNKERIVFTMEDCVYLERYLKSSIYFPPKIEADVYAQKGYELHLKFEDALNWITQEKDES